MSLVTAFCIPAVVSGIVASAHKDAVPFDFLCHGCDMLSDMLRDLTKRLAAHDPDGNGFPVIQGELFKVSWHRYLLTSEQLQTIQYVLRYVLQYVFQYNIIDSKELANVREF
jgi:hypothetical protein